MPEADLQELLARAIDEALQGRRPDLRSMAGDEETAHRLESAFDQAVRLLPVETPDPDRASEPRRFGPYLVEDRLGHGGTATVLLGRHEQLGRLAAIKVLPHPLAFVAEHRERFRREALALARLDHPGVLAVHEVGEQDGLPYAALEYVSGGSLEDVLRRLRGAELASAREEGERLLAGEGPWERRVAGAMAAVADALSTVHLAGIVHRDIKPANILLAPEGRVVLGDFGLALQGGLDTLTHTGAIVGTRRYLAPELTGPGVEATAASDVYALGVSLYELLTLQPPFAGDTEEELFRAVRERVPTRLRRFNRHVSPELEAVCLQALEKSPARRFASASEMAADLHAVARGGVVRARGPSRPRRFLRAAWSRRQQLALFGAVLLALSTLVLGGVLWKRSRDTESQARLVRLFQEGQAILASDEQGTDPQLVERREQALSAFRECTRIAGDRVEPWMAAAESALRLERPEEAKDCLEHARALGAQGFYLHWLEEWPRGFQQADELPRSGQLDACAAWSPLDKLKLSEALVWHRRYKDAFEIVEDPALMADSLLSVDLLLGVVLGADLAQPGDPTLFADANLQARLALAALDRFLVRHPGNKTVSYNRAILIRDGLSRGRDFGADASELIRGVEPFFREYAKSWGTAEAYGELLKLLLLRWKGHVDGEQALAELVQQIEPRSDALLLRMPAASYCACVEGLILAGRYERALQLLRQQNFDFVREQRGPLHMLLLVRWFYAREKLLPPDVAALGALFEAHRSELGDEERAACEAQLAELEAL